MIDIDRPSANEPDYKVRITGSSPVGEICTTGTAFDNAFEDRPPGQPSATATLVTITGRVYQGNVPDGDPSVPPANAAPLPAADPFAKHATITNQTWRIDPLPNAQTGPSPGATNTLFIWAEYLGGTKERARQLFRGVAANNVECDPGVENKLRKPAVAAGVSHTTAPLTWKLTAAGFSGSAAPLNGTWSMKLGQTLGGYAVWTNGASGDSVPLVELRTESPQPATYRLNLRVKGAPSLSYEKSADEWKPIQPNVLDLKRDSSLDLKTVPSSLTLTPG